MSLPFNITNPGFFINAQLTSAEAALVTQLTALTPSDGDIFVYRTASSGYVLESKPAGGGSPDWGDIVGTLSNQTDLQSALDAKQASNAGLASISGLTTEADRMIYTTASDTYAVAPLTSAARSILDDTSTAAIRTTLGVGTAQSPQFTAVNIGAATDTTLGRTAAGIVNVEGNPLPRIFTGTTAPATTPGQVGDIFIDTTNDNAYVAIGTASSADWVQTDAAGGGGTGDVTAAVDFGTDNRLIRSDGTTKGVQASNVTVNDLGEINQGTTAIKFSLGGKTGIYMPGNDKGRDSVYVGGNSGEKSAANFATRYNTGVGFEALEEVDGGQYLTAVGYKALGNNGATSTGSYNTALGAESLFRADFGSKNTAVGSYAGFQANNCSDNVFVGFEAGRGNAVVNINNANRNVCVGFEAGRNFGQSIPFGETIEDNILIGYRAGKNLTYGDNNILIGKEIDPSAAGASNELNIGDALKGNLTTKALEAMGDLSVAGHIYADGEVDNGNSSTADTVDWGAGNFQKSTMTGNCTYTFTAPDGPGRYQLMLVQDATGSRTATWPGTVKWPGGTAPTLSTAANSIDIITFYYDGTSYYGVETLDFQ